MGIKHICGNCGTGISLNSYSAYVLNGYCQHCGVDDLRKAVKTAYNMATHRERTVTELVDAEKLKVIVLTAELEKYKPKPRNCLLERLAKLEPKCCTRCRCLECVMQEYNKPYNFGGRS